MCLAELLAALRGAGAVQGQSSPVFSAWSSSFTALQLLLTLCNLLQSKARDNRGDRVIY